jgi:ArsR family transcriptional regulator
MRDLIKASKAISDETRLRILHLLMQRECCVCEVMQALDISQARASRNLSALYDAGFLKLRHDGLWSLYSIDEDTDREYCRDMLDTVKKSLEGNEQLNADIERLKTAKRIGVCCVGKN